MGDANRRGSFEQRRKEAIERKAKEAAEWAAFQASKPRPRTSKALQTLAMSAFIASVLNQKGGA